MYGDTVVIGALNDDDQGIRSGSAYVFVRSGGSWSQQAKLLPSDGAANDYFGEVVALDGNTAVIGATEYATSSPGSAYVFTRTGDTWSQQVKLTAADGAAFDYFGGSVAVRGGTVVIGADGETTRAAILARRMCSPIPPQPARTTWMTTSSLTLLTTA